MLAEQSKQRHTAQLVMQLMHFEYGTNNKKDIKYWVKYGVRYGFKHLVAEPISLV